MAKKHILLEIDDVSSAAAGTTRIGKSVGGLELFDDLTIDVAVVGATGGTVDVFLQKLVRGTNLWADYAHIPAPVAAGATKYYNLAPPVADATPIEIGMGTDVSAGTLALAAGKVAHGHPGTTLRLVTVTGAGVSAAANVFVYITARN